MYGLTEIQLMNEMVGSNLGNDNGPRIGLRKACSPRVVRRARLLYSTETDFGVFYDDLDWLLQHPITHGEWEARQQQARLGLWSTPEAQFTEDDIAEYECVRKEQGLPSVSRVATEARQKAAEVINPMLNSEVRYE